MESLPTRWTEAKERLVPGASRSVLMLDYDGTLAPFHEDRSKAALYPGVEQRLAALSGTRVVFLSGRSAHQLRALLPSRLRVDIWGSHGHELLREDGSYELFAIPSPDCALLTEVERDMTAAGLADALERKPCSLAAHWRNADPGRRALIRSAMESSCAERLRSTGLELLPFDGGLELRSPARTKGTAVRDILATEPHDVAAAYLGDDLTDEDAFRALGSRGLSVLVRSDVRPSSAQVWLRPPEDVLDFLDAWKARTARGAP